MGFGRFVFFYEVEDWLFVFFFQAEDGIRLGHVTGVQTCALPISGPVMGEARWYERPNDVVRGLAPRRRGRLTHHPWTLVDQGAQQCSQRDHLVLCWLDTRQLVAPVQALPLGGRLRDTVEGYEQRRNSLSYPNPASVESAECA